MQTTTNYGYNLVESTDTCNVPVQISPNFSDIDTDLKAVSDAALTSAIDTFASNVHALVRDDADRNLLFFIAPADYVAGDTFTVDGVSVNVTDVAGNALASNAFRVNSAVIGLIYGSRLTLNVVNPVTIPTPTASGTTYDNTLSGLTATDVQAAIDEILASVNTNTNDISSLDGRVTALENGGGNDYSITEHVVGKWVDGVTDVYERTLYNVAAVRSVSGSRVRFDFSNLMSGLTHLVSIVGIVKCVANDDTFNEIAIGSGAISTDMKAWSATLFAMNTAGTLYGRLEETNTALNSATLTATVRYTK